MIDNKEELTENFILIMSSKLQTFFLERIFYLNQRQIFFLKFEIALYKMVNEN